MEYKVNDTKHSLAADAYKLQSILCAFVFA